MRFLVLGSKKAAALIMGNAAPISVLYWEDNTNNRLERNNPNPHDLTLPPADLTKTKRYKLKMGT